VDNRIRGLDLGVTTHRVSVLDGFFDQRCALVKTVMKLRLEDWKFLDQLSG
jgi:hypothetical protein